MSSWPEDAACAGMDTNLFVIDDKRRHRAGYASPQTRVKLANALAVCRGCPMRAECLAEMLLWPDPPRDIIIAALEPRDARRAWLAVNVTPHHHTNRTAS